MPPESSQEANEAHPEGQHFVPASPGDGSVDVSRREFLAAMAAGGIGTVLQPSMGNAADVKAPRSSKVEQLEEKVKTMRAAIESNGCFTTEYSPERDGKEMRCRGVLKPVGWTLTPIAIVNDISAAPGASMTVVHPVPCDIGDQIHIASALTVQSGGKTLREGEEYPAELISCRATNELPYRNAFLRINIPSTPGASVHVQLVSWVMLPVYAKNMTSQQFEAGVFGALAKESEIKKFRQAREVPDFSHSYEIGAELRRYLQIADQSKTPAERLHYAFQVAGEQITYESTVHSSDPNVAFPNMLGDCSVKSNVFKALSGGHAELGHGFIFDMGNPETILQEGGDPSAAAHTRPYILTAQGLCACEPAGGGPPKILVQGPEFIATALGKPVLPHDVPLGHGSFSPEKEGIVYGIVQCSVSVKQTCCTLSVPGRGRHSAVVSALRPEPDIVKYMNLRKQERLKVYMEK